MNPKKILNKIDFKELTDQLIRLGIALTNERDLDRLLELIVSEARLFTNCDAATLYTVENDHLCFVISQNESLAKKGGEKFVKDSFKSYTLPIENSSLSGYVANTGRIVNIPDAYKIPKKFPFKINRDFDKRNKYRTKSILTVPLSDPDDKIIGVLQLINAMDKGENVIPFSEDVEPLVLALASYAAVAYKNANLTKQIKEAHYQTIIRLSTAAEYRDVDTSFHIKRMSMYSACIAESLGLPKKMVELIEYASPMHDIGKLGVPDSILLKPGPLTPEERKIMEKHTTMGANILSNPDSEILEISLKIALSHHERFDGLGYPNKLTGDKIPLEGRIVALADVFDALASRRVYKPPYSFDEVVEIIKKGNGTQFDPLCVSAFINILPRIERIYQSFQEPAVK